MVRDLVVAAVASLSVAALAIACSASRSAPLPDAGVAEASVGDAGKDRDSGSPTEGDGPPFLTQLAVSSAEVPADGSPPLTLVPPFSPSTHDYYVRCIAGANPLTVTMTASEGSESSLIEPSRSPSKPAQTLSILVKENQAIVAAATRGAETTKYWVRCLPHDFPELEMTTNVAAGTPSPG